MENNICKSRIVKFFDNEQEALDYETYLINHYKQQGLCSCNVLNGGTGKLLIWTDADREYFSKNNPMKNKEVASRVSGKLRRPVFVKGEGYESAKVASDELRYDDSTVRKWCYRGYDNKGGICYFVGGNIKNTTRNSTAIYIDGIYFDSIREGALYIKCSPNNLSIALKNNKKCKGYTCKYANQQPSQANVEEENSSLEGSETNG